MKRKYTYPLLMMIAVTLIFLAERYLDAQEKQKYVEAATSVKSEALDFFLPAATSNQIINHDYYTLEYNEEAEQASWVAYTLTKDQLVDAELSRPYFEVDPAVKTGAAHWRNYKNSGYDRGHLCPAGDRRFSPQAYDETFLTSNISPQLREFNGGIWNRLENQVRDWARRYGELTVVTGGLLEDPVAKIGEEEVYVPSAFYKIVIRKESSGFTALAFLVPHSESDQDLKAFVVTIDAIEELTKLDFFPQLDDATETQLEASNSVTDWKF
ncbi:DNA/RNA non-specific endonuclease [Leeuwenhoekiella nanhaiensis]|uniref:Endonuclease n=1 Tax=Leeuwenhoekiella nanhaiensis TaxID=1655491 RepID=A0A2G1VNX6_9FLAO|nr:DNA/RNA non-specific endonuclease [Leeuwenhoekiella nanhaiensis]PHQ28179.1 endonuclease [Leeuwenhoekiella nanhaiensis]